MPEELPPPPDDLEPDVKEQGPAGGAGEAPTEAEQPSQPEARRGSLLTRLGSPLRIR